MNKKLKTPSIKTNKIPRCRRDAFLRPCFSSENRQWDCHLPAGEAAPFWCFQGWQKPRTLHGQAEVPPRWPGPPERPGKRPWPSPGQAQLQPHGSVAPGSTQRAPPEEGTARWTKPGPLDPESGVWGETLKNRAITEILLLRWMHFWKYFVNEINDQCRNYLHTYSFQWLKWNQGR